MSLPGDQDAVASTEAVPLCGASWTGGSVYDLSGNVREWTTTTMSTESARRAATTKA